MPGPSSKSACDDDELMVLARGIESDCERLRECPQWAHRVGRFLDASLPLPAQAARLAALFEVCARGEGSRAWLGFVHAVYSGRVTAERLASLYDGALEGDFETLRLILMAEDVGFRQASAQAFAPDPRLASVSLGQKKSLARRLDPEMMERLSRDGDPSVTRILLENPRLTEALVLRMVALRPHRSSVLREFGVQHRWICLPQVRRALVLNPYTPIRLALFLAPLLDDVMLREVTQAQTLHPALKRVIRALLTLRPRARVIPFPPVAKDPLD